MRTTSDFGHLMIFIALCASFACLAGNPKAVHADDVGASIQSLLGGSPDPDHPFNNAVVSVEGRCSGTLVGPDMVLTSGHCVIGFLPPGGCQICSPADMRTCVQCNAGNPQCTPDQSCRTNDTALFNGRWQRFPDNLRPISISFGADSANPRDVRTAQFFNSPQWIGHPFTGHADIVLIGLTGGAVPSNVAIPRAIWTTRPPGLDATTQVGLIGFSTTTSSLRQRWRGPGGYSEINSLVYAIRFPRGVTTEGGDSGAPVLFGGWNGNVMGVNRTASNSPRVISTFGTGDSTLPNLSSWLREASSRSLCSAIAGPDSVGPDAGAYRKLMGWWSETRTDNFATTDRRWNGCYPGFDRVVQGTLTYGYFRLEGWVARPDRPQPPGTVPLYLYWDGQSMDNATVTPRYVPVQSSYARVRLLGYVWSTAARDRTALHLWFSPTRKDYFTTTQTIDYRLSGYQKIGIIGYVRTASSAQQDVP